MSKAVVPELRTDERPPIELEKCKRIWIAVLEQAFIDASCKSKKLYALNKRTSAIKWLTGSGKAFDDVCLKAGFDPKKVRAEALRLYG